MGMFERLLRFFLGTVIVLLFSLHGIVNAESSNLPLFSTAVATLQPHFEASSEGKSQKSTASAVFDCSSRKLSCHGDWFGPLEANSIRSFKTDLPSPKKRLRISIRGFLVSSGSLLASDCALPSTVQTDINIEDVMITRRWLTVGLVAAVFAPGTALGQTKKKTFQLAACRT